MDSPEHFAVLRDALARDPANPKHLHAYCYNGLRNFCAEVIATLRTRLAAPPIDLGARVDELALLAVAVEYNGRQARGASTTTAASLKDVEFAHARGELAAMESAARAFFEVEPTAVVAGALSAEAWIAQGAFAEAEHVLAYLRNTPLDHVAAVTTFDRGFHAGLPQAAEAGAAALPATRQIRDLRGEPRVVFVSADFKYFQIYGKQFLRSFCARTSPNVSLLLHIMDMSEDDAATVVAMVNGHAGHRIGISTEWTGLRSAETSRAAREYYHSVRLLRLWQAMSANPESAFWMMDMDTVFNGDAALLFELLNGADLAPYLLPGRIEARNKVSAHMLGVAPTAAARDLIQRAAGYVVAFKAMDRLLWGIDQIALYTVLVDLDAQGRLPSLAPVPDAICDGSLDADKVIWSVKA